VGKHYRRFLLLNRRYHPEACQARRLQISKSQPDNEGKKKTKKKAKPKNYIGGIFPKRVLCMDTHVSNRGAGFTRYSESDIRINGTRGGENKRTYTKK